jgi:hypothetical protein
MSGFVSQDGISAVRPLCTNGGVVFSYNEGQTL